MKSQVYEVTGSYRVSKEHIAFLRRRVRPILSKASDMEKPIVDLLAEAYALGMSDAIDLRKR